MENLGATLGTWLPAAMKAIIPHPGTKPSGNRRLKLEDGSAFFEADSEIWQRYPDMVARYNPPAPTLPLPFKYYGQPFYKGYSWETKV